MNNRVKYFVKKADGYALSCESEGIIAELCPPIIEEDGAELLPVSFDGSYIYDGFEISESVTDNDGELFSVERSVKNTSDRARSFKLILALRTAFAPEKYLIPCVSYDGNKWGEGKEPKGMCAENGEVWVHSYDRTAVPSCTETETKEISLSLFAAKESLVSSCSIAPLDGGRAEQRIIWPVTEAPLTYSDNDKYTERYDTYITLEPGESFFAKAYVIICVPKWENFGICRTLDRALELFPFEHGKNRSCDELWRLGIDYSRLLIREHKGRVVMSTGIHPTLDKGYYFVPHYEVGWCGQNIMNARMQIIEYLKTGEEKLLKTALDICDSWRDKQSDEGLVLAHYEWYTEGRDWNYIPPDPTKSWAANVSYKTGWLPETCNTAWAACEMLKVYKLLLDNGIERPDYRDFACRTLDFFCDHYSEEFAFGKGWHFDGRCAEKKGTIGAFVTMALCDGWRILKNERYLEYAERSLEFYMKRDVDNFVCTAGAIDCTCVDKETAGPVIIAALDLYEFTGDAKYVEWAEKASYYFASWMFVHDAVYGEEAEFTEYGYYTSGSTAVSVQHPALDQWGELMCSEWLRLADITGDQRWRARARMMWYNATQLIADEDNRVVHGKLRPIGSQNEAFYQARWGHRPDPNERGHLNDWLVSWVNVFRLNVIDRLTTVCGYSDTSELE